MTIEAQGKTRVEGKRLAVGIDIAKGSHVAVVRTEAGAGRPLKFGADREGFEKLVAWLDEQRQGEGADRTVVGLEPTGHYWLTVASFLAERGVEVVFVNPLHTKRMKEIEDNSPDKSDPKDAAIVAELVFSGKTLEQAPCTGVFAELRELGRLRHARVVERGACENRMHRITDVLFPELLKVLPGPSSPSTRAVLRQAVTPKDILGLGKRRLSTILRNASRGQLDEPAAMAVLQAAKRSVGVQESAGVLRLELKQNLLRWKELTKQIGEIEELQRQSLGRVPYAERLLKVPGLGPVTVARVLGEAGDLKAYHSGDALVKMAGLNLYSFKSGKKKGPARITKRGRPMLRHALFMAVLGMTREGRPLETFYERLTEDNGVNKVKALVAASRKLLRALYAMVRDGSQFDETRLEPAA
jgi:transposase